MLEKKTDEIFKELPNVFGTYDDILLYILLMMEQTDRT